MTKTVSIETLATFKQIMDRVTLDISNFMPYLKESVTVCLTDSQMNFLRRYGQPAIDATKSVLKERLGGMGLAIYGWHIDLTDDERGFEFHMSRHEPNYEES